MIDWGQRKEILEIADQMKTKLEEKKQAKPKKKTTVVPEARGPLWTEARGPIKRTRHHEPLRPGLRRKS